MTDFDFSTLVTDRTRADVEALAAALLSIQSGSATPEQIALAANPFAKGGYNYTDLNRVTAAMEYLVARLQALGYAVPYTDAKGAAAILPSPSPDRRLPEGYTELAYIESSGTQYVDTNFKPDQSTRVVFDYAPVSTQNTILFGARTSSGSSDLFLVLHAADIDSLRDDYRSNKWGSGIKPTERTVIDKNQNVTTIGDATHTHPSGSFQSTLNLYLFGGNTGGSISQNTSVKLYSCQIYDNGALVRDYIPCMDAADNIGLYDVQNGVFYPNSGTGTFSSGPPIVRLPDGYQQVEYIQSSGTQYIDSGVIPNANTKTVMDFQLVSPASANECIFGVNGQYSFRWYGTNKCFRSNGAENANFPTTISSTDRHIVEKEPLICTIDGSNSVSNTLGTVTMHMYIFAQKGASSAANYAKVRCFIMGIYDNGTRIRHYIPCINPDGAAGLYDLVNSTFYPNAGTGEFTAGPEVPPSAQTEPESPEIPVESANAWMESDHMDPTQARRYLGNIAALRAALALPAGIPQVPPDMEQLNETEANAIETILGEIQAAMDRMTRTVNLGWAMGMADIGIYGGSA
ncbi:hypothetical protein [uncultured Dysosmobacter sp.]|uniref:hypothetical protein n=1 Tax=uncultured Dysosmobacter sp. TaxID=2591384 RepID=UPI002636F42B|nr:hypothetical protein [uncultured Dysosmobacter sp.]